MIIETEQLIIIPLTQKQFKMLLGSMEKMEEALQLMPSGEIMDPHLQWVMKYQFEKGMNDISNWIWHTNRQIILKSENKSVGSINFKNTPEENVMVEIGYGTHNGFRNKGYMTETVKALSEWALKQPSIKGIIAETEKSNLASQRVLQKAGMTKYKESDMAYWWKLDRANL